jgi:hypothetical protein
VLVKMEAPIAQFAQNFVALCEANGLSFMRLGWNALMVVGWVIGITWILTKLRIITMDWERTRFKALKSNPFATAISDSEASLELPCSV